MPIFEYKCQKCGNGFVVKYDVEAGEGEQAVPAACPHCWQVEQVQVGLTAAVNNDYRVDKAEAPSLSQGVLAAHPLEPPAAPRGESRSAAWP